MNTLKWVIITAVLLLCFVFLRSPLAMLEQGELVAIENTYSPYTNINSFLPIVMRNSAIDTGRWRHKMIGAAAGAAPASGNPASYAWENNQTQHVFYTGTDNQIHELWWNEGAWHHRTIGQQAGAPDSASDPSTYTWDSDHSQHVVYRGTDNQIHEIWWRDGTWYYNPIGAAAGAAPASGNPTSYAWENNQTQHVFYTRTDNQIHELWWNCVFRRKRSPIPADADRTFRCMAITRERDNAGNKIIPLVVVWLQRGMNFSH